MKKFFIHSKLFFGGNELQGPKTGFEWLPLTGYDGSDGTDGSGGQPPSNDWMVCFELIEYDLEDCNNIINL